MLDLKKYKDFFDPTEVWEGSEGVKDDLMSQFQFKFDIPSAEGPPTQTPSAPEQSNNQTKKGQCSLDEVPKHRFQLMKDFSKRLRDRRKVQLEYKTVDLTPPLGDASAVAPLLQVCSNEGIESISGSLIKDINRQNTDLLTGVYEGGLKVWECSLDLCRYLALHCDEILSNGGKILELGCGHGLPACLLLREGLKRNKDISVMFTDYNDFVLHGVALSNIALNTKSLVSTTENFDEFIAKHVVLGAGDWMDMSKHLALGDLDPNFPPNGRFDVILAAETIYTADSAKDTATLLARHLTFGSGIGLVACKRYYFGVGGGSDPFREAAASQRITQRDERTSKRKC